MPPHTHKGCVQMTGTHYPQRSHKMLVLNVPGWFGFLFNIVKPLLNEAQRAKINIFRASEVRIRTWGHKLCGP